MSYIPLTMDTVSIRQHIRLMRLPNGADGTSLFMVGKVGYVNAIDGGNVELPIEIALDNAKILIWCSPGDLSAANESDKDETITEKEQASRLVKWLQQKLDADTKLISVSRVANGYIALAEREPDNFPLIFFDGQGGFIIDADMGFVIGPNARSAFQEISRILAAPTVF